MKLDAWIKMLAKEDRFYGQHYSDNDGEWKVVDIARYIEESDIPLTQLSVDELAENNLQIRSDDVGDEKPGDEEFVARAEEADLSYPIMVVEYPDGLWICDGVHRLWKARSEGLETIDAYLLSEEQLDSVSHEEMVS